jgi:NAD(P)-dependent dehydrogenase (short-subunit alcohol dehydrogenase family)
VEFGAPELKLAGKMALIIVGIRGIGAATARLVAELGAKVVITGRRVTTGGSRRRREIRLRTSK